jgi:hypothetical protein
MTPAKQESSIRCVSVDGRPSVIGLLALGMAMLLETGVAQAEEPPSVSPSFATTENGSNYSDLSGLIDEIRKLTEGQIGKNWKETADAVLILDRETKWNRYLKTAMNLPDFVDLGIENRTRFESYDHPWRSTQKIGGGRTDSQVLLRSRVRVGLDNGPFRFLFEGQDSRAYWNNDQGDFVNDTTVNEWDILQLFWSVTLDNVLESGLRTDLHFGRMTLDFGKRRYVSRNDFTNATKAFDGVHWQIGQGKTWRFRAFLVEPVIRDQVKLDEQNANNVFWGTYVESQHLPWFNVNAFYFGLNDQQLQNKNLHRTYSTFGLRLFKPPAINEFDYEFEGAIQRGHLGNVDHFAYNPNAEVGYTLDLPWTPRFWVQYTYASGTRTPGGSQEGNFDPLFGERQFDLMPTGNFGPFIRSNISSPGWRLIVQPAQDWKVQVKQRFWYLAQSKDSFGSSGLRDSTGRSGNDIGHDVEFRVQWAVGNNMDFDVGYDHWFKGSYFDRLPASANLPAGGNKDTDYFYLQMKVRL